MMQMVFASRRSGAAFFQKRSSFLKKRTKRLLCLLPALMLNIHPQFAAAQDAALEQKFDAAIHPDELRDWMKTMAAEPNHVGTAHDKANAEFELALFRQWGWDAHIEVFDVLYPTPLSETLELTVPTHFVATLREKPVEGDSSSAHIAAALPAYVAYQGDGDVTAPLVYVNYGMQDDYKALDRLGIDVRGRIVIARYGHGWRGLKPKLAQDHGAVGCIIYSDPADDGYSLEKTYPDGPMRPAQGIQRGSVADMPLYPGDPLTPGIGATPDAKRISRADAPTILKIPVLPISYGDAQHFLAAMEGPVAPDSFRGALPITYHVGPGPAVAHLAVKSSWDIKPIYDVIATMRGAEAPDQWVIRGNHHDGWVFGASDPLSGQVALLAEAKAIGQLAASGFRPRRTIIYASWDAEEPMLLGSTEWVETHADELKTHALLYINSDTNVRGTLQAGGSADFTHLVNSVANDVTDPETGVAIGLRRRAALRVAGSDAAASPQDVADAKSAADPKQDFPIDALGSGSDFSPFLQHLGVPALDISFDGEGKVGGVYHSAYDTFDHHSRFGDPGFVYDATLAKTIGRLVLRAADAPLPQQNASGFADAIASYVAEIKKLADTEREQAETQSALLRDHVFTLAADPTHISRPPASLDTVPYLEFAPLDNAVARLKASAQAYDTALAAKGATLTGPRLAHLQQLMQSIDQTLSPAQGLPGRAWYKNLVYAPGRFTGYDAKTLPGVREAIEERRWADANTYAGITAAALNAYSDRLDTACTVLNGG